MKQVSKYLAAFAGGLAFVGAGIGGYVARGMVDVGRWPLLAQRDQRMSGLTSNHQPISTDPNFKPGTEADYFYTVADLIQHEYVEPVAITDKMAEGAIKGMVATLSDPESRFFDVETYPAFHARENGEVHGAGVELQLQFDKESLEKVQQKKAIDTLMLLPVLSVTGVYPGSGASAAGLMAGDVVTRLNGKYLLSYVDIQALRKLQEDVTAKKADPEALTAMRKALQVKAKETMSTIRARDVLYRDSSAPFKLEWLRGGQAFSKDVATGKITVPAVSKTSDGIALRFILGAAEALKNQQLQDGSVIDLRNSGYGTFASMKECMFLVCPKGPIGNIVSDRGSSAVVNPSEPSLHPKNWTLLVDSTTRGAAAVFARTLERLQVAKLSGEPSPDDRWVETIDVDGKTGYTLVTGRFKPAGGQIQ